MNSWRLHDRDAQLRAGALVAHVDVSQPELGLNRLAIDGQSVSGTVLAVSSSSDPPPMTATSDQEQANTQISWSVADAYVRGSDLVATYHSSTAWPYATQIYWSAADSGGLQDWPVSLSLMVSLQTSLLDTWPTMFVGSRLCAEDVLFVACQSGGLAEIKALGREQHRLRPVTSACCVLQRLTGSAFSYAEIMPASDMREVVIQRSDDDACHARWELFAEFLEKGVIRRARMHTLLVPRAGDVERVVAACGAIERRPLPLTT
jgi:hypothetical protein